MPLVVAGRNQLPSESYQVFAKAPVHTESRTGPAMNIGLPKMLGSKLRYAQRLRRPIGRRFSTRRLKRYCRPIWNGVP
jgi:hypothetical protein